jgi:hypothetical protein
MNLTGKLVNWQDKQEPVGAPLEALSSAHCAFLVLQLLITKCKRKERRRKKEQQKNGSRDRS